MDSIDGLGFDTNDFRVFPDIALLNGSDEKQPKTELKSTLKI